MSSRARVAIGQCGPAGKTGGTRKQHDFLVLFSLRFLLIVPEDCENVKNLCLSGNMAIFAGGNVGACRLYLLDI